jgi:hypothetical protein
LRFATPGEVCAAMVSHAIATRRSSTPCARRKGRRGVGAVNLETLLAVSLLAQPDAVQDATEKHQLVVIVGTGTQAAAGGMGASEDVAADAVVEDELGRGSLREGECISGNIGFGQAEPYEQGRVSHGCGCLSSGRPGPGKARPDGGVA